LTFLSKQALNISFFFLGGLLVLSFSPFNFYLILPLVFTMFFWLIQKNNFPLKESIFFGLGFLLLVSIGYISAFKNLGVCQK